MKINLLLLILLVFVLNDVKSQVTNNFTPAPQFSAAGHYHSMFLCNDGKVNAWGRNDELQLGDTISADRFLPVEVAGLSGIISIAVKFKTSMALKSDSTVWTWGLLNGATPTQIVGLSGIVNIAAGNEHCMALKSDSTVWTWGYNTYGQLGNGNTNPNWIPAQVSGLTGVVDISGGDYHSLALKADGTVWAFGNNDYGCLGDSTMTQRNYPVQVRNLNNVISISCGLYCNYVLKSDGTIWAWGENFHGKLGDGTQTTRWTPVQVIGLTNMIAVVAGQYHGLAIKSDSTVWAWGENNNAQLGNGNQMDQFLAIQTQGIDSVVAISAGGYHSFAIKADGTLWGWGSNQVGQLGNPAAIGLGFAPIQTLGLCNIGTAVNQINSEEESILIYPNPSNGKFIISNTTSKNEKGSVKVYDAFGKIIYDADFNSGENKSIDLFGNDRGLYFAVINVDGKLNSRKLILE